MPFQDVPNGLIRDGVDEIGQCSDNPVIAPTRNSLAPF